MDNTADEMPSTLEARLAQWEQRRDDARFHMDRMRKRLDLMPSTHPMRRTFIMRWNENLSRYEWANTEIARIKATIKARDGKL